MSEFRRAGLRRRAAAWIIDLVVAVSPAVLFSLLPGVFIPLDRFLSGSILLALPLAFAALVYVFVGYVFLPNTYGRYVLGIRVTDAETGERPQVGQGLRRALTTGLWPVEAMLVAFSNSKQRLGDRWAGTAVVHYQPSVVWWRRAIPGVIGGGAVYSLLIFLTPWINARMEISGVAREYVRHELNAAPVDAPHQVMVFDDEGTVTMRTSEGQNLRVYLSRQGGVWKAERAESIPESELGSGFSVQQGSASASAGM
jgi:uncharacterized RDD family membrane protein YckC